MTHEPISSAKNNLSAVLRRVAGGETVIITDRGSPVARLEPIQSKADDERLQSLIDRGTVRMAVRKSEGFPKPIVLPPGTSLLEALLEERETGR